MCVDPGTITVISAGLNIANTGLSLLNQNEHANKQLKLVREQISGGIDQIDDQLENLGDRYSSDIADLQQQNVNYTGNVNNSLVSMGVDASSLTAKAFKDTTNRITNSRLFEVKDFYNEELQSLSDAKVKLLEKEEKSYKGGFFDRLFVHRSTTQRLLYKKRQDFIKKQKQIRF